MAGAGLAALRMESGVGSTALPGLYQNFRMKNTQMRDDEDPRIVLHVHSAIPMTQAALRLPFILRHEQGRHKDIT